MPLSTTLGAFSKNALGITGGLPYGSGFIGFYRPSNPEYNVDAFTIASDGTVYIGGSNYYPPNPNPVPTSFAVLTKINGTTGTLEFNDTTTQNANYSYIVVAPSGAVWFLKTNIYTGLDYLQLFNPVTNTVTAQKVVAGTTNTTPILMMAPDASMYIASTSLSAGYSQLERTNSAGTTTLRLRIAYPISAINSTSKAVFKDFAVDSSNNIYALIQSTITVVTPVASSGYIIAKFNSLGTTLWKKKYTYIDYTKNATKIDAAKIKIINNRIFLFAQFNMTYYNSLGTIELDSNGNVINAYQYLATTLPGPLLLNLDLFPASGGGFYGCADRPANTDPGQPPIEAHSIYFEMDSNLNMIWVRTIQVDLLRKEFKIHSVYNDPVLGDMLTIAIGPFVVYNPAEYRTQTYVIKIPARYLPGSGVYQIATVTAPSLPNPTTIKILDAGDILLRKISIPITTLTESYYTIELNSTVTSVSSTTETFTNDTAWNVQLI